MRPHALSGDHYDDHYLVTATSPHPAAAHTNGTTMLISAYANASHQRRFRASDTISLTAAENVDIPPKKPATNIKLVA